MRIEEEVIQFCAPVLVGIKPANLFSVKTQNYPNLEKEIRIINEKAKKSGLCIKQVKRCEEHSLIFVYRKKLLEKSFLCGEAISFLTSLGYKKEETLEKTLERLFRKLSCKADFPHEVGLFLGYPLEDILGFVKHQGKNFKSYGYWKVYSDEQKAKTVFKEYDQCKARIKQLYRQGVSFTHLCVAS